MSETIYEMANLYIPETVEFPEYGLMIEPTDKAEEFEQKRTEKQEFYDKQHHTANLYVKEDCNNASSTIKNLEMLFSFAQHRDIYSIRHYVEGDNGKVERLRKFRVNLPNDFEPIIPNENVVEFVSTGLDTLESMNEDQEDIMIRNLMLHRMVMSIPLDIKFLLHWIGLEQLGEANYEEFTEATDNYVVDGEKKEELKDKIDNLLCEELEEDEYDMLSSKFRKNYLYEHSASHKILYFLEHMNISLENGEMIQLLDYMKDEIRNPLTHEFDGEGLYSNFLIADAIKKIHILATIRRLEIPVKSVKEWELNVEKRPEINWPNQQS